MELKLFNQLQSTQLNLFPHIKKRGIEVNKLNKRVQ